MCTRQNHFKLFEVSQGQRPSIIALSDKETIAKWMVGVVEWYYNVGQSN
jgi:hypothetical protein